MPRPAVGVRPSASCYAPAVPRGLLLCGWGFGDTPLLFPTGAAGWPIGLSRSRGAARFAVVPRGVAEGMPSIICDVRRRGARFSFTTSIFSRCPH